MADFWIRAERASDARPIRLLNRSVFEGENEVEIVDRLRTSGLVTVSLVAEDDAGLAGHILFSRLPIVTDGGTFFAVALGPMAVRSDRQRRGIGSALVRAGLDACRRAGEQVVIVVGHKNYYPKFGFSAAAAQPLRSPFSGDVWMALELVPGALEGLAGEVRYPPAWGIGPTSGAARA